MSQNRLSLVNLPDDVLVEVLQYLSRHDLLNARLACRRFWELSSNRKVLNIKFIAYKNEITLQKLPSLLKCMTIRKNITYLALVNSKTESVFSLHKHLRPIASNFSNLQELLLRNVTVEKRVRIQHLPPSLRSLDLRDITFESDALFFTTNKKQSIPKLKVFDIHSPTKFGGISLLYCFNYTLTTLSLYEFKFGDLNFCQLKGKFPLLEKLDIDLKGDEGDDSLPMMEVIGTFKTLKDLMFYTDGFVIKGFKYLNGFDKLQTLNICNLEICEEDFVPTFPNLKSANISLSVFVNRFCCNFVNMFPVMKCLDLDEVGFAVLVNMKPSTFVALAAHPTLNKLRLNYISLSAHERIGRGAVPPASCITELSISDSSISYNGARLIGKYFSNVVQLVVFQNSGENDFHFGEMVRWMKKLKKATFYGLGIEDLFYESVVMYLPDSIESYKVAGRVFNRRVLNRRAGFNFNLVRIPV